MAEPAEVHQKRTQLRQVPPSGGEGNRRQTILISIAAVLMVLLGYAVVVLLGGNALRGLPFAEQIAGLGERLTGGDSETAHRPPLPALEADDATLEESPSPVVPEALPVPAPSPSPSFIPPEPNAPSQVTFTIEFENTTGVKLTGVRITDRIPAGTVYEPNTASPAASFDGSQLVWDIGTLLPGQRGSVRFNVLTAREGRISNRAVLTSNEAPPSEVESSATVN